MNRIILSILAILSFVCTSFAQTEESFVYKKVTSQSDIVDGGVYTLAVANGDFSYYSSYYSNQSFSAVSISGKLNDIFSATDATDMRLTHVSGNIFNIDVKTSPTSETRLYVSGTKLATSGKDEWDVILDSEGYVLMGLNGGSCQLKYYSQTFIYYSKTGNTGNKKVYLYRKVPATPQIITIGETGYSTLCNEYALDFTDSNIKAYTAKINDTTSALELTQVYKVPAHNAVVLYSPTGAITESIDITTSITADDIAAFADNALKGTVTDGFTVPTADEYYALAKKNNAVAFYPVVKGKLIPSHKAYIYLPNTETGQSKSLAIRHTDVSTAVNTVRSMPEKDAAYNLSGQRVGREYHGIVVRNGKKYAR